MKKLLIVAIVALVAFIVLHECPKAEQTTEVVTEAASAGQAEAIAKALEATDPKQAAELRRLAGKFPTLPATYLAKAKESGASLDQARRVVADHQRLLGQMKTLIESNRRLTETRQP